MLSWFRKGPSPHQTALAMIGAKAGDRVLLAGSGDPDLAAELAGITGLNGQTLVVAPERARAAIEQAAARAGTLVELLAQDAGAPLPAGPFDVAVWTGNFSAVPLADRGIRLAALLATLRPGGRIVVIDRPPSSRFGSGEPGADPAQIVDLLTAAGALAARRLAAVGQTTYYEARISR